jgi:hypothetical protein
MAGNDRNTPSGQQPEAEASLEAAARSGSRKPEDQGLEARPDTAPRPESSDRKQAEAAEILREGARKDTGA